MSTHPPRVAKDYPWLPTEWSGKPIVDIINPYASGPPWWLAGGMAQSGVLAAYQPKGAANATAARINVANPGSNDIALTGGNTPTWTAANGWVFDKTQSQSYKTPFSAASLGLTFAILIRYSGQDASTTGNYITGVQGTTLQSYSIYLIARAAAAYSVAGNGTVATPYGASTSGVLGLRVSVVTLYPLVKKVELWMNGSKYSDAAESYSSPRNDSLGIGASFNVNNLSYVNFYTGKIQAILYTTGMTDDQMSKCSAAMAEL
jgi:hypothetical protein